MGLVGAAQMLVWGSWLFVILWGSILAVRGARNWATLLLAIGAGGMMAGVVIVIVGGILTYSSMTRGLGVGPSPGSVASSGTGWMLLLSVGGIFVLAGVVSFTAGYVGLCAKYGATVRRARELEVLVGQLQARIQAPS